MRAAVAVLLTALAFTAATPLAGQRPIRDPGARTVFEGVVVDERQGDPLANTIVLMVDENRGMLTDSIGRFRFTSVRLGPQLIAVKQYGYGEVNLDLDLIEGHGPVRIELEPGPIALDGFTVVARNMASMARQLETRRRAAGPVRAYDQARLASSSAADVKDFLKRQGLHVYSCGGRRITTTCVLRRGALTEPRVYIDEARVIGGLEFLAMYRPYELYLVEVYSAGRMIRAYTHWYMERMAGNPQPLP